MTSTLKRPTQPPSAQATLFEVDPPWQDEWWGMPAFDMGDARPAHRVTVNFMTREDLREFAERLGVKLSTKTDSMWYPEQTLDQPKEWEYVNDDA